MTLSTFFYKLKKAVRYFFHFGPKAFFAHLMERLGKEPVPYAQYYEEHTPKEDDLRRYREKNRPDDPLISVLVPAYETPEEYLRELLESFLAMTYDAFELVIADASDRTETVRILTEEYSGRDGRIRYEKLPENAGISQNTNAAFQCSKGAYVSFLDHDDLIAPHALSMIADAIRTAQADMIYTDEDKIEGGKGTHYQPNFKPDFNLDLLRSNNYITHFLTVKRSLAEEAGLFDPAYDGAQDYDFILRCAEKAEKIVHIPEILYHWRTHAASTADNPASKMYAYEAGRRAISAHLARTGTKGEVSLLPEYGFYRVTYPVEGKPLISVIIPNKDERKMLSKCIEAVLQLSYQHLEILIAENNSTEEETFAFYRELETNPKIRVLRYEGSFNYAAINNYAVREAKGEYYLFLNNDVRMSIDSGILTEMLGVAQRPEVGAVGARLYYPNNTIQHAGIVIGIGGVAGAVFTDLPRARKGYLNKAGLMQDLSAVTAALMLVKKEAFEEAGGFTEELKVAFNDVDLCLKMRRNGRLIVYDPFAEAYHDESRTRGAENTKEKLERFDGEIAYMKEHWKEILTEGDPYYNKNLSLKRWDYSIRE